MVADIGQSPTLIATLASIAAEQPEVSHLVLASADWLVEALAAAAPSLREAAPNLCVPYPEASVVARGADKAHVMAACERLGIPHPATAVVHIGHDGVASPREVTFPAVVKVASTSAAHEVSYPGQAKVHVVANDGELGDLLDRMASAGLRGDVLVQEQLPGGDSSMAAANMFLGRDGQWRFGQFGRVLLEEHTPTALGNSVAQVTADSASDPLAGQVLELVADLLADLRWTGFANVDLMRDGDGRYRVLEVNPRVGRSGYAVTASGYNVARMYVQEFLGENAPDGDRDSALGAWGTSVIKGAREHLFTVVPVLLLRVFARAQWRQIRPLVLRGRVTNPLYYRAERSPKRWLYIATAMVNQARKFARTHPASPLRRS